MRVLAVVTPFITFLVSIGIQVLLPPLLQLRMSAAEYSAYVLVSSTAGYVGMADAGMWMPTLRELTALHGRGALGQYVGELVRCAKIFLFASLAGLAVAIFAFLPARTTLAATWPGASENGFLFASLSVLVATALRFWLYVLDAGLLFSTGRYVGGQLNVILNSLVPALVLSAALVLTGRLDTALWWYAASIAAQGLGQGVHAWFFYRHYFASISPEAPPRGLKNLVADGFAIKTGDTITLFGLPHALTMLGVALVPAAIPARTLANGCRLIGQQFLNFLELRFTRETSTRGPNDPRALAEFHVAASLLSAMHVGMIAIVDLSAVLIFTHWLPPLAPQIRSYLPGLMADQALLSGALPSSILFVARGDVRSLGIAKLVGGAFSLVALPITLQLLPEMSFGLAYMASTLPFFVLGFRAEILGAPGYPPRVFETKLRYARSLLVAASYGLYARFYWLPAVVGLALSIPVAASSLVTAVRLFARKRALPLEASASITDGEP